MQEEPSRDLAALVVPQAGRVVATGSLWEPYRLVDPDGLMVEPVAAYLRELQAAGRSEPTLRSYGNDLLRWFRFLWAIQTPWSGATRVEARDFCRWMLVAGKPVRPHWRRSAAVAPMSTAASGKPYAPSVRAHWETVLRGFYEPVGKWSCRLLILLFRCRRDDAGLAPSGMGRCTGFRAV
jgi:Phage integrase, N-terminal SAM-like domain